MIDVVIRNFVETQNISEPEWNGLAEMISPQKKDTFSNELMKESEMEGFYSKKEVSEMEDVDSEKEVSKMESIDSEKELSKVKDTSLEEEENEGRTQRMISTFFVPFVEVPYVVDSSYLGNLNEVGELLQEISQEASFLENGEEIHNTIENLQQTLSMNESVQMNVLENELPFLEVVSDSLQLLVKKSPQIQNENQSVETVGLHIDNKWGREKEAVSEETPLEVGTDTNKKPVELSMEQFVHNESLKEQFIQSEFSMKVDMTYEQTTLSNLADKLQQKIEYLQQFTVKTDKAFIQLDPENLGKIDVVMQKIGDTLMIEVDVHEQLVKKNVEVIFEDLQMKLQEQNVEVQLSFTEREAEEQEKQQKQKQQRETNNNKTSKRFAEILGLKKTARRVEDV